jgi:hypothetical protein
MALSSEVHHGPREGNASAAAAERGIFRWLGLQAPPFRPFQVLTVKDFIS